MVAVSGRGWVLPNSLRMLVREVDMIAPRRRKASDGSIGDLAHSIRTSDHNPSGGFVHAVDITHDPINGMDIHRIVRDIAARKDPRVKNMISNWQIWSPDTGWKRYRGVNGHTSHAHIAVKHTSGARNSNDSWFTAQAPVIVDKPKEIFVPAKRDDEEEEPMKLFRDHNNTVWLWYPDGTRKHVADGGHLSVLQNNFGLELVNMGNDSPFYNPIVSGVWLLYIRQVA